MANDVTVEILKQIRDGIGETNQRLDHLDRSLNERIDETNQRLDKMDTRLGRVENGLNDLGKFMRQIAMDLAKQERRHNEHVKVLEKDMSNLKSRMNKLERKKGA